MSTGRFALAVLVLLMCTVCCMDRAALASDPNASSVTVDPNSPLSAAPLSVDTTALKPASDKTIQRHNAIQDERSGSAGMFKTEKWYSNGFVALGVVLALIAVTAWGFKRFLTPGQLAGSSAIKVLHRVPLSSKQSLAVVRLGRRVMLIGITPEQVSHLATIADELEVAELLGPNGVSNEGDSRFKDLFKEESDLFDRQPELERPIATDSNYAGYRHAREDLKGLLGRVKGMTSASRTS